MSTTRSKIPTTRGISALLRKNGFEKSVSSTTAIQGWHNYSTGFRIEDRGTGRVRVHHVSGAFRPSDADRARSREAEDQYAEVIRQAGYAVSRDEWGELSVTENEEQTP